ncbi:hypothetical protein HDU78_000234, partial [Chytriomyces hyalinus]
MDKLLSKLGGINGLEQKLGGMLGAALCSNANDSSKTKQDGDFMLRRGISPYAYHVNGKAAQCKLGINANNSSKTKQDGNF